MNIPSDSLPAIPVVSATDEALHERIDALADEAWSTHFSDRHRAETLAREALRLAEEADYSVGIALALRTLGAQRFYFESDYDAAEAELSFALELLNRTGETRGRADILNSLGNVHRRCGRQQEATQLHLSALDLSRSLGDRAAEARSLSCIGNVYHVLGDFGRALEHHQASLVLREEIGDVTGLAHSLTNIGIVHGVMGEPERVIEYTERALAIHDHRDAQGEAVCLANLGQAYADLGDDDRALEFLELAAARLASLGNHGDEANCLASIGRIHERRGDTARALACYLRSRELVTHTGARIYLPETLITLGSLRVRMGNVEAGLGDLHEALRSAEEQGARQHVYAAHEALAEAYTATGDTARALEHHRAFHLVWREVYGTETNLRIQHAVVRAEVQQTQREAELLREKNEALTRRWGVTVLHCPYCHGYEVADRRLGILATSEMAMHQAQLIPDWSADVTLFTNGTFEPDAEQREVLAARGVRVEARPVEALMGDAPDLAGVRLRDGDVVPVDALFTAARWRMASPLAEQLGCDFDDGPFGPVIRTDGRKATTVPGVFAGGDATRFPHSATFAAAEGAMAGFGAHQSLVMAAVPAPTR